MYDLLSPHFWRRKKKINFQSKLDFLQEWLLPDHPLHTWMDGHSCSSDCPLLVIRNLSGNFSQISKSKLLNSCKFGEKSWTEMRGSDNALIEGKTIACGQYSSTRKSTSEKHCQCSTYRQSFSWYFHLLGHQRHWGQTSMPRETKSPIFCQLLTYFVAWKDSFTEQEKIGEEPHFLNTLRGAAPWTSRDIGGLTKSYCH